MDEVVETCGFGESLMTKAMPPPFAPDPPPHPPTHTPKLQALVYDILLSTTAVFSYAIGSRNLSANEQFFGFLLLLLLVVVVVVVVPKL